MRRLAVIAVIVAMAISLATVAQAEVFGPQSELLETRLYPSTVVIHQTPTPSRSPLVERLFRPTTARYLIALVLLDQDRRQTVAFLKRPDTFEENPLLGRHPSEGRMLATFAVVGVGGVWLLETLPVPDWLRISVTESVIATETALLDHNANLLAGRSVRGFPIELRVTLRLP